MSLVARFEAWWRERYPTAAPAGPALRTACPDRWLRLAVLSAWPPMRARQAAVAGWLLGDGSKCFVVRPGIDQSEQFHVDEIDWDSGRCEDLFHAVAVHEVSEVTVVAEDT